MHDAVEAGRKYRGRIGRRMVAGVMCLAILLGAPSPGSRASAPGGSVASADPTWRMAVAVTRANRDWVPGLVGVRVELFDSCGRPEQSQEVWTRVEMGPEGDLVASQVRFAEDGAVASSDEQRPARGLLRDEQSPSGLPPLELFRGSPFDPEVQKDVSASRTGERRELGGRQCVGFTFSQRKADGISRGIAWLDEATGAPVEVHVAGGMVPGVVGVRATIVRYGPVEGGAWCAKEMFIEGVLGFMWMRRAFRVAVVYADYWSTGEEHAYEDAW
ncbi:MAG: hypothetical protein ACM3ZU_11050 [Bacteroidota bacterium]